MAARLPEVTGTMTATDKDMPLFQTFLAHQLRVASPIVQTQIIAQQATSHAADRREAIGHAIVSHIHAVGANTAILHLSRDTNDDVRAAAIKTATTGVSMGAPYLNIVRRASLDPCARIRRLALSSLQRRALVADPDKLNSPIAPGVARSGRSLQAIFPARSRTKKRENDVRKN